MIILRRYFQGYVSVRMLVRTIHQREREHIRLLVMNILLHKAFLARPTAHLIHRTLRRKMVRQLEIVKEHFLMQPLMKTKSLKF